MTDIATSTDLTIARYDADAEPFFAATVDIDMSPLYAPFLAKLAPGAAILDAGCGSGRDARAFREQGYAVTAIEPSPPLARLAAMYTGLLVEVKHFQAIDCCERFDGIWACASLLHVPLAELPAVLQRLARALRPAGVLYVSFKYGAGERDSDGRHFTDLNETALAELLDSVPELMLMELWTTADRRSWREAEQWLNALLHLTPLQ